ncbi:apolipoprotein N-acyltransferase, partial [Gammaproteobacteria bacterium]|nr:apolipoprotein N-acyltransferase [Gammaproteobacteria bacterium]
FENSKVASITIVQPNTLNKLSYDKEETIKRMNVLSSMSFNLSDNVPDIILWPEAPLILPYNSIKKSYYENILSKLPSSTSLVTGSFYEENGNIYNSIINISDPSNLYHKKHLVPFGEYLPFRTAMSFIYNFIGINIYDLSKGKISNVIKIRDLKVYSLICYESIFSKESLIQIPTVDFILNVSNDGWFGDSLAPYQHLDALRMRALENQRYAIRSANNGISAIISPYGNIEKFVPYNKAGLIETSIVARNGHTPLSKYGYKTLYIFIFLIFIYATIYFNIKVFNRK